MNFIKRILSTLSVVFLSVFFTFSQNAIFPQKVDIKATDIITPDTTILFAQKDTSSLYLDIFYPEKESETMYNGKLKPTIIYVFGGGFAFGRRDDVLPTRWYKALTEQGFSVIAIDYRLGLKGVNKAGMFDIKLFENAINMAVEDLFSATRFLIDNGAALGIDPNNLVITGSSAGAVASLQADYELNNRTERSKILPDGFKYSGVISFSGGIFSREGLVDYKSTPAPTLLLHGIDDRIVTYNKIQFFNIGFFGANKLAKRFEKYNVNYNILRYKNHGHEIASAMLPTLKDQLRFIYTNIMDAQKKIVDAVMTDPNISNRFKVSRLKDIYRK